MAEVVLDTNVLLDYLDASRPEHRAAVDVIYELLDDAELGPVVTAGCLKDVYYILCRRYRKEAVVRQRLDDFRQIVRILPLDAAVLDAAFASDEPDLEDALVRASAELVGARAIVTRDVAAYSRSSVPAMAPRAFLATLEG